MQNAKIHLANFVRGQISDCDRLHDVADADCLIDNGSYKYRCAHVSWISNLYNIRVFMASEAPVSMQRLDWMYRIPRHIRQ